MDGQIMFDALIGREEETYRLVEPTIRDVIRRNFLGEEFLSLQECKGYWSITYSSALIARIHFGRNISYVSIDSKAEPLLTSAGIPYDVKPSEKGFVRILIQKPEDIVPALDIVANITQQMLDAIPKDFDCCSRFEACSDARQCVQPDDAARIGCGYRKILASGRIFYGANRNID